MDIQTALHGELRDLMENNPLGVAIMRHVHDDEGGVTARRVFANDSLRSLFGVSTMDELVNRPVHESWVDIKALERVNRALAAKTPLSGFEAERIRPDGSRFWVSMTGQPIVLLGEELTIVWHLDITSRITAEENSKASEAQLRDYMDSSIDWFWEMDADLRFTYMSSNVERIVGVPPEWHYGKTREELLGADYDRSVWASHFQVLKDRQAFRDYVYFRGGDGVEHIWISTSGKPIFSDQGAFLGYHGTGTDITDRIENQELRNANRAKSEFLSSMSHELRTPLNGILGFSQVLENDRLNPITPRQQLAVGQIRRGGEHLLDLINQVLDLAAIENRKFKPSLETIDTAAVITECLSMAEVVAAKKQISIQGPTPESNPPHS
jgi:PAS domain S-box-containing protein